MMTMTCSDETGGTATVRAPVLEQRTLRSARNNNKGHDESDDVKTDEDIALEREEEKLMACDEDEEIESCDESGRPVVDTDKLERRMMTVALVKSVVETSGTTGSTGGSTIPETVEVKQEDVINGDTDDNPQHSYGLRKRSRHSSVRDSPGDRSGPGPSRTRATRNPGKSDAKGTKSVPAPVHVPTIPLPAPPQLPTEHALPKPAEGNSSVAQVNQECRPASDGLGASQVPNPLMYSTPLSGKPGLTGIPPINSGNTTLIDPVPCPLPASATKDRPQGVRVCESVPVATRGRVFSIDIDPEGLVFPDIGVEVSSQGVLAASAPLLPVPGGRSRSTSMEAAQAVSSDAKLDIAVKREHKESVSSVPSELSLGCNERSRAMSFEFFSFGINADEPLPPVPELNGNEVVHPAFTRQRGDSIVFEPDSFRDGGIHEEHYLLKSRTASIDLCAPDEIALMNTPGFVPAPASVTNSARTYIPKPSHLPSPPSLSRTANHGPPRGGLSVSGFSHNERDGVRASTASKSSGCVPSHITFQMELLNKGGRIGIYLPDDRKARIAKFHSKRKMRIWRKRIKYDCRKKLADSRPRIKGRFVKRSDVDE